MERLPGWRDGAFDRRAWPGPNRLGAARDVHAALRAVVAACPAEALNRPAAGGGARPALEHIRGVAAHDVYRAGQIRLLRR